MYAFGHKAATDLYQYISMELYFDGHQFHHGKVSISFWQQLCMTKKRHNHRSHTNTRQREEETQNNYIHTAVKQSSSCRLKTQKGH